MANEFVVRKGLIVSGSTRMTGSLEVSSHVSASEFSGSFYGDGSNLTGVTTTIEQASAVGQDFTNTTYISVGHNLNTSNPIVQVYNSDDEQIIPQTIRIVNANTVEVEFPVSSSGTVVVAKGGHIVSGSAANAEKLNGQTASYYLDYTNLTNIPSNIVSASTQFTDDTAPFTGSFSGSFYGDGSNLSGVTSYTDSDTLDYINSLGVFSGSFNDVSNNPFTSASGVISASGDLVPTQNELYDLGSPTLRWKDLYLSGSTVYLGETKLTRNETGDLEVRDSQTDSLKKIRVDELELGAGETSRRIKVENGSIKFVDENDTDKTLNALGFEGLVTSSAQLSFDEIPGIPGGLVSASSQVNLTEVTNFISGIKARLNVEGALTGSAQLVELGFVRNDYTASTDARLSSIENTTSSLDTRLVGIESATGSLETRAGLLESATSSLDSRLNSVETTTSSFSGRLNAIENITGSFATSNELSTVSSSFSTRVGVSESDIDAVEARAGLLESATASLDGRLDAVETTTSSLNSRLNSVESTTSSFANRLNSIESTTSSLDGRVDSIEAYSSSLKSAISLSGADVTLLGNLTVQGTQTIVNSQTVVIEDNIIELNGSGAAFGGILVNDVTQPDTISGSLLWDSNNNYWVAGQASSEERVLVASDKTELQGLIDNLEVASASLNSFTSSINTTIKNKLNSDNVVSGSSQISHDSTTGFVANEHIDHSSVSISAGNGLSGGGNITTNRTISLDTTSATFTTGVKSKLNADGVVSSSGQINHDSTTGFVANEHIDHSSVSITAGTGLTGGGTIAANRTISLSHLGIQSLTDPNADRILFWDDSAGATAWLSTGTGISISGTSISNSGVTSNVAGTGISVSGATGAVTITNTGVTSAVAGNAITVSGGTGAVTINHADTSTQASVNNSGRTFIQDITLDTYGHVTAITSATDADTYTGTVTSVGVSAGNGLTGGGTVTTSGTVTLNVGAGTGIDVAADAISVDVSDFMSNGSNNRIVTATGTDAMNAEANLTYDGTTLEVYGSGSTVLDIQGSSGQLFSVTDDLTGVVFSVNDISGIPIIEAEAASTNIVTITGEVRATSEITAYYSDERLKEKIDNIQNPLDIITSLNGFKYVNNDRAKDFGYRDEKVQVGLSAQEVQAVLPEIVSLAPFDTGKDGDGNIVSRTGENYLTLDYAKLVPVLVEAIKEQQNQINELRKLLEEK